MTPTEQDKELEATLLTLVWGDGKVADRNVELIMQLITADRKRIALEAKIEICDKYLSFRAASDTEHEAIQWLDFQRNELHAELKAQQEELL